MVVRTLDAQSSSFINVSTITNQQKLIDKRYEKQNNIGMIKSDLKKIVAPHVKLNCHIVKSKTNRLK